MKIFMTGGSGYVGRSLLRVLTAAGHDVSALSRSDGSGDVLIGLGAVPVAGDLLDPSSYEDAASNADAIVHLGFDYRAASDADRTAIDAFLEATAGREALFVATSGMWVVGDTGGRTYGDHAPTDAPARLVAWRVPHERRVLDAMGEGRVTAVVRPGYVYGRGGGSTARMFATAEKAGSAEYVGDGTNHWNNIHVEDLARLYLAVIESRSGGIFQGVDGAPETVADIATAASIAAGAGGQTHGVPLDDARLKIGPVADAMCLDQLLTAPAARSLGWRPHHQSFTSAAATAFAEWRGSRGD